MKKKCFVMILIFSFLALLFFKAEAEENNTTLTSNDDVLLVNEGFSIDVTGYHEVRVNDMVNDEPVAENKEIKDSGYYEVTYVSKFERIETVIDENNNTKEVTTEYYESKVFKYTIVNVDLREDEVYFEEKKFNLEEIKNVSYTLNGKEVIGDVITNKEGHNELVISNGSNSKTIEFDIFKFNNKEELDGNNFTQLQTLEYTQGTNAKVYLNNDNEEFDGNINTFGNYHFEVRNTKDEIIGQLSFVIDPIITINGTKYTALNSVVELKGSISLSTYAKIEYSYEPLTQTLSGNNIYNGYVTYNPGLNTLKISGVGSYNLELLFKINPTTNIIDNHTYEKEVLPMVSGGNVKINGYDFELGNTITTSGKYEMVISGLEQENVSTFHFNVSEEELNVKNDTFTQAIIPAKTNNHMTLNYKTLNDEEYNSVEEYNSGEVISKIGYYKLDIYYPTYEVNDNDSNPYNDNKFIKSSNYYVVTYEFEIKEGINIIDGKEYFDSVIILFSGDNATLTFDKESPKSIPSGYIADKVGKYSLDYNGNIYNFTVTPRLNVEDSQVYLDQALILKSYDFTKNSDVEFKLVAETGTDSQETHTYTTNKSTTKDEIINKTLSVGTYELTITANSYTKKVNFIVISSKVISRGQAYTNGKNFEFLMYGVKVFLTSPNTETRNRTTAKYNQENIYSVGKHYFTFEFNGTSTSTDVDSAIFFYVLPVVKINNNVNNSKTISSDLKATLTFKDGLGSDIENDNYHPLSLDNKSNQKQIEKNDSNYYFDEIGIHYITLNLDGYSYRITLTIDSYFYEDEIKDENKVSSSTTETYATTTNVYETEVTFVTQNNCLGFKLDDISDANGVKITEVGNHKLYLYGTNGYKKVLTFVIKERVELATNEVLETKDNYKDYTFKTSILLNIYGDAEALLDTASYTSGDLIETVGNHILVIKGANGYTKNYRFSILETLTVNSKGGNSNTFVSKYYEAFSFGINYDNCATCTLNGKAVLDVVTIDTIGYYTLKITGTNAYVSTYSFEVLPTLSFVSKESADNSLLTNYKQKVTPTLDNSKGLKYESVTLNGAAYDFDTPLDTVNTYELVLTGVGSYKETKLFSINESLLYSLDNNEYTNVSNTLVKETGKKVYIKKEYADINYVSVKLNGKVVSDSELSDFIIVDTLGNNKLVINNVTYEIKLTEVNVNLYTSIPSAKANKLDSLDIIKFDDELTKTIKLDGCAYTNLSISTFGLHRVTVEGVNYTNTYYFFINLNTNIENNKSYNTNIDIKANTNNIQVLANTTPITGTLDKVGTYKVTFSDVYGSEEQYTISLEASLKANGNDLSSFETADLINIGYVDGSNKYSSILLNGNDYDFTTINTIGNNELVLVDINGNETLYTLTINSNNYITSTVYADAASTLNNEVESFTLGLNQDYKATVKLDETDSTNNLYGLHKVTVLGVNDYEANYYYAIKLVSNLEATSYELSKDIDMNAKFTVDGNETSSVTEVGNHKATIYKYNADKTNKYDTLEVEFVITEKVSGFDEVNNNVVTPLIEGEVASVALTNVNYQAGDKVTKVGKYTLTITGSNGYVNNYSFEIIPVITFESENDLNTETKKITCSDSELVFDVYLNGKLTNSNVIDTIGNNKVEIKGFDYSTSYDVLLVEETNVLDTYNASDNFIPMVTNLNAKALYLDGKVYDGKKVTSYGTHEFKVLGVNDYENTYYFDVTLDTDLLLDEYNECQVINSNSNVYVNELESNSLELVGYNKVKYVGLDKENIKTVLLKENINGYNGNSYIYKHLLRFENVSCIILDDNRIDAVNNVIEIEVKEVGNHTFKLLGLNNYESQTYSFTIIEDFALEDSYNNEVLINVENVKGLLLNGKEFENNTLVTLIGKYKLTVLGVNGYKNTYEFTINYNIEGIEDGGIYVGKAYAKASNAKMTLDGNEYLSGDAIYEVGYHTLVVKGDGATDTYTYNFTILPDLTQNELVNDYELNDFTLNEAKAFNVSSDTKLVLTLNGNAYDGSLINKVGKYELVLEGSNGYKKIFSFTVEPEVMNVNSVYNDVFVADISDNLEYTLTLNGKAYDGSSVNRIGNYELVLTGVNGYSKEFKFTVEPEEIVIDSVYEEAFAFVLAGNLTCDYLLNGKTYDGSSINKVGNYTLVLNGENYTKEFNFQIKETLSYLNGEVYEKLNSELIYNDEVIIRNDNDLQYEILLNDEEIASLTSINKLGNNKLVILGENGYKAQYNLLLKETVNFADSLSYKDSDSFTPSITNKLVGDILIDGLTTNTLKGFGKHIVTIKGLNYEKNYDLYIELDSNIEANDIYNESKEIIINSLFTIDGKEYNERKVLDEVGNHKIVILGANGVTKELNITITEKVAGIEDNGVYNSFVTPNIKNAKLLLDGMPFESETNVTLVGNYVLEVLGTNEYKKVYNFTINNKAFEDNQVLNESLLINIPDAKLYVDGIEIENNTIIEEVGVHTLQVVGLNGYSNEYKFTINNKEFLNDQIVKGGLLINIPNAKLFVDGEKIENNSIINEVGYHTLTVMGANNYSNEYKFTITPDTQIVQTETEKGMVASITSTNVCQSIEIDDVYYEAGQSYSNIGNHTLKIIGANGYEYETDFTVDAALGVSDEGVYKDKVVISVLDANEIILDGVEVTKDVVISNGTHTLTIIGANGYEKTVTFTYYNPNNMFVIICTISLCLVFITTLGATLFVKKRKGIK